MLKENSTEELSWDNECNISYTSNYDFIEEIRNKFKIIAEPLGTPRSARKQNKVLIAPFLINKYDSLYLYEKGNYYNNQRDNNLL